MAFDKKRISADFGRAAESYEANARLQRRVAYELLGRTQGKIKPGGLVADLGSGTGFIRKRLAAEGVECRVAELDISYDMCRVSGGMAVTGDIGSMPFADGVFDYVISASALQWVADLPKAAAEIARVLKKGGRGWIATFGPGTLRELREALDAAGYARLSPFPGAMEIFGAFSGAGFRDVKISSQIITYHYSGLMELAENLKSIGAGRRPGASANSGLMTKSRLARIEKEYSRLFPATPDLPATWEVLYVGVG